MSKVVRHRHLTVLWTMALVIFCVMGLGVHSTVMAVEDVESKLEQSHLFLEVMATIEQSYINESSTEPEKLIENAIRGMVEQLDRYSAFFTRDEAKEFNDQTQGHFDGLGISINVQGGWLTVVQTLHGTPAEEAGILAGDKIVEIDGETTKGISLPKAVKKLKGPKGSSVKLKIARRGEKQLIDKEVTRDTINPSAIIEETAKIIEDGVGDIGYVRLQDFSKDAASELERYIREMDPKGMKALVLDLRDNYGGLLDVAVDVCDLFLERGEVVVTYRGREDQVKEYQSRKEPMGDFLLAILVNEFSASASEIVAGCIQDHGRGIIVGSAGSPRGGKTFGKGSVQTLIPLSTKSGQGAMIKLTTAKYYTPKERSIDDMKGLTPDILANVTPDEHWQIRFNGRYGELPPDILDSEKAAEDSKEAPNDEELESPDDRGHHPAEVTPSDIFEQEEKGPEEQVYDMELLAAYQSLKAALILNNAQNGGKRFARTRN